MRIMQMNFPFGVVNVEEVFVLVDNWMLFGWAGKEMEWVGFDNCALR